MKKFMFSAVALVAFSFAGMANTGGEEKLEVEENLKSPRILTRCEAIAHDTYWLWKGYGASDETSIKKANEALASCKDISILEG